MSGNSIGEIFKIMTFGESHGPWIGVVIDGVQPGLELGSVAIQQELQRRRPGQSHLTSSRSEPDSARIISGIFEGKTTGTPICILIENQDQRSKDYRHLKNILRPGHAAFGYLQKYGIFDYRGGGRASGRETATRVAAGAVAKQFLQQRNIQIIAYTRQIGQIKIKTVDLNQIEKNEVRAPDAHAAAQMIAAIEQARSEGDSLGGIVEIIVQNCPAGLGEPVFEKLEAELARALMSIGAVKGVEVGSGFRLGEMRGSEANDLFYFSEKEGKFRTRSNHAGGVLGGISSGEDLLLRIAVKPPSSINKPQQTADLQGNPVEYKTGGRHDPCICPRVVPVAEAMTALVLIDMLLLQERIQKNGEKEGVLQKIDTIDRELLLLMARRQKLQQQISGTTKAGFKEDCEKLADTIGLPQDFCRHWQEFLDRSQEPD
ncbi:MAG: chorismate synthase [Calditrichia bacterium]